MAGKTFGRMNFHRIEGGEWSPAEAWTRLSRKRRGRLRLFFWLMGLGGFALGWWLRVLFGG